MNYLLNFILNENKILSIKILYSSVKQDKKNFKF